MSVFAAARRMIERNGTEIALTRTANAASAPSTPWIPGSPTETVYTLDAYVSGTAAKYADGTTVLVSDLMVVASPVARLAGVPTAIVPAMGDTITIDGKVKTIKAVRPAPAAGPAALYRIFVAS